MFDGQSENDFWYLCADFKMQLWVHMNHDMYTYVNLISHLF